MADGQQQAGGLSYLSLFSGLEAAHVATAPLGWRCAAVAEVDPNACVILAHRLPNVPNLGDVTRITDAQIAALGPIDVVIGGSPCQDLSVAGKRAGIGGARSSLFHEQLRIFHAARSLCGARWLVWENVPGAFSSNAGADFALVVGAMAGCVLPVPADGWGSEGVALGDSGLVEWAVLDSQWFGVAQRRRRVFAVLDTGDWASRAPILLEPESLRGDSPPSREARESVAGTLAGGARSSGGYSTDGIELIPEVAGTMSTRSSGGCVGSDFDLNRGTPLIACMAHGQGGAEVTAGQRSPTLTCNHEAPIIAFSCKDHGADAGDIAPTLRSMGHDGSHANGGGQVAVAFNWQSGGDCRGLDPSPITNALHCGQVPATQYGAAVRRLTPTECERLQALPDGWTLVPKGKKGNLLDDGPRYKALGNTFTASVVRWICARIDAAHADQRAEAYASALPW